MWSSSTYLLRWARSIRTFHGALCHWSYCFGCPSSAQFNSFQQAIFSQLKFNPLSVSRFSIHGDTVAKIISAKSKITSTQLRNRRNAHYPFRWINTSACLIKTPRNTMRKYLHNISFFFEGLWNFILSEPNYRKDHGSTCLHFKTISTFQVDYVTILKIFLQKKYFSSIFRFKYDNNSLCNFSNIPYCIEYIDWIWFPFQCFGFHGFVFLIGPYICSILF